MDWGWKAQEKKFGKQGTEDRPLAPGVPGCMKKK